MKIFRFFGCVCEPWTLRWLVLSEQAYKTKNIKLALHTNRRNAHVWETGTVISDTSRHAGDLTQSCKSVSQVVLVNETVSVLIHYGKSLQKYYCYTLWFQYAQSDIHHRQNCWQSKKKEHIWAEHWLLWTPGSGPVQTWRTRWSWLRLQSSSWLSWGTAGFLTMTL